MNKRGRKRYTACILVCVLFINLFVNYFPVAMIQAKENTEQMTEVTTEAMTEETVTTEEVITDATTEKSVTTEETYSESVLESYDSAGLEADEQEVFTDATIPCLDVKGKVVLTEDTVVRYVFWSDKAVLDLNGYSLTVTEDYSMDRGTLKLNDGLLKCEKGFKLTGKASLVMTQTNDHLIVPGNLQVSGNVDFQKGIIEAKGDVTVNSLFKAGENATFIFSGEQKQVVQASDGSNFGHIIVQNYSTDGLYIEAFL